MSTRQPRSANAYLVVERDRRWSMEAKVVKVTQGKPSALTANQIAVKVKLRIPAEAWDPFQPEAVIDVPADLIQHPIEVEAVDPS